MPRLTIAHAMPACLSVLLVQVKQFRDKIRDDYMPVKILE